MDPAYAERYRDLFERHWWWRARNRLILRLVQRLTPADGWRRILDVGCGDGLFFDELSRLGAVQGVEPDASLLAQDQWQDRIHLAPFDARLGLEGRFSLILMLDVLEHMSDPISALEYARELLEPCGRLLITVPALPLLWTDHDDFNQHLRRYTERSLQRHCSAAGIALQESWYFFHWTVPVKLVVRFFEHIRPSAAQPPGVPPVWINEPLYRLSSLEQRLSRALPIPFGSSLLAIGHAAR